VVIDDAADELTFWKRLADEARGVESAIFEDWDAVEFGHLSIYADSRLRLMVPDTLESDTGRLLLAEAERCKRLGF
jgi:hypothetical protein